VPEETALTENPHEDQHVDDQADDPGGHEPDGEKGHRRAGQSQREDDPEPQPRGEEVLAEEDRSRLAEDGEQGDENLIERLERSEEDQDEHDLHGVGILHRRADQRVGHQEQSAQADRARHHDRPYGEEHAAEHPVVVALLLVLRHEPAQQLALAE
jgi:hypothetical protein